MFVGTVAAQSITGSFINRVYGYTDIISCFTNVPIYVGTGKLSNIKIDAGKKLMFSNNIVELDVVSSLEEADIDRRNLT